MLSGAALDIPGFAEALQAQLGVEVRSETVGVADGDLERAGLPEPLWRSPPASPPRRRRDEGRQPDPGGSSAAASRPARDAPDGGAYAVLGLLGGLAVLALLYGIGPPPDLKPPRAGRVADRPHSAGAGRGGAARSVHELLALREQRVQAVSDLVDSRFDWAHAFHELGRVLPRDASITSLDGTVGSTARSASLAPSTTGSAASSTTSAASAASARRCPG